MADWPAPATPMMPGMSTLDDPNSGAWFSRGNIGSSAAWPASNTAVYTPYLLTETVVAQQIAFIVGTSSGNIDVGIYSETGTRLVSSGSTACGASGVQAVDITDTTLTPGVYFVAMNCDNTTATFNRTAGITNAAMRFYGVQNEAVGSVTLPATATMANPTWSYVPAMVVTTARAEV